MAGAVVRCGPIRGCTAARGVVAAVGHTLADEKPTLDGLIALAALRADMADKKEALAALNARWEAEKAGLNRVGDLKARLDAAGVEYAHVDEVSLYFRDPDGARLELIADPLTWMYGEKVV